MILYELNSGTSNHGNLLVGLRDELDSTMWLTIDMPLISTYFISTDTREVFMWSSDYSDWFKITVKSSIIKFF